MLIATFFFFFFPLPFCLGYVHGFDSNCFIFVKSWVDLIAAENVAF